MSKNAFVDMGQFATRSSQQCCAENVEGVRKSRQRTLRTLKLIIITMILSSNNTALFTQLHGCISRGSF